MSLAPRVFRLCLRGRLLLADERYFNRDRFGKSALYFSLHTGLLFFNRPYFAVGAVDWASRREYFRLAFARLLLYLEYLRCTLDLKVVYFSFGGSVGSGRFGLLSLSRHFSA